MVRFETFKHILPASTKPAEYDDPLTEEDDRDPVEVHLASSKRAAYAAASRRARTPHTVGARAAP